MLPAIRVADADFWSLRFVDSQSASYTVRRNVPQPLALASNAGVMATVYAGGGYGYAATPDTSEAGFRAALERAAAWAKATARVA
jgi:predicted Zn-dependent protease